MMHRKFALSAVIAIPVAVAHGVWEFLALQRVRLGRRFIFSAPQSSLPHK